MPGNSHAGSSCVVRANRYVMHVSSCAVCINPCVVRVNPRVVHVNPRVVHVSLCVMYASPAFNSASTIRHLATQKKAIPLCRMAFSLSQ